MTRRIVAAITMAALAGASMEAMSQADPAPPVALDPVVVTATRNAARAFDVPASVDVIPGSVIRDGQPGVNLSESLARVPGVFAANRQNYAQDLQISSRGFGARAAFGVRGVRLYQDGIPVTMPDGQGQTGSFSLLSASRIEVLRGPFSTLYGNASGGVISVFSEDGADPPSALFTGGAGSYESWTAGIKVLGSTASTGYVAAGSEFQTQGYREHSAARRDLLNVKLRADVSEDTRITLIGNWQYQPDTQDPLGLTRAQWEADPQQADPAAVLFNTRKTIDQTQGGAALDQRIDADTLLHVAGYGGERLIRQYLALPGTAITSSGGVADLDRNFGGVGARLVWRAMAFGAPLTLNVGADTDQQLEHRRGYVNNNGDLGDLRRDESDKVQSGDVYAEFEWLPLTNLSLTAGVRSSVVRYTSQDHFVVGANPDDSGARTYRNTSPVLGAVYHALPNLNFYASYGQGFETPTFAEIAYRPNLTGLNLALNPATSTAYEIGMKTIIDGRHKINAALFHIDTEQEIVTDTAIGGRNTYRNAGKTRRNGAEFLWDGQLPWGLHGLVALTWLNAEFVEAFSSGSPPLPVLAGNKLPGVPAKQAYGELTWVPGGYGGLNAGVEVQYVDQLYVNDRNTDSAPAYTIANARIGFAQVMGNATLSEFVRLNNAFDRKYVGSVIVGDVNQRYFEPAPPRNWYIGVSLNVTL